MREFGAHVHPISRATVVGVGPHGETKMARKNLHQCWPDGCVFGEFLSDIECKQYDADLVIFEYDLAESPRRRDFSSGNEVFKKGV